MARRGTSTSNFGVSRREAHDASGFYARFTAPEISDDDRVAVAPDLGDGCLLGDARDMSELPDNSVALVVTSPPYFAGKEYEEEVDREGIPSSYVEYLELLRDVFTESKRVLEPGGRIAVNVANLGRKPYRSLSSDVIDILQDLGLLLRGEIVWRKARGMSGSCAWGSFASAANPVLRDTSERIVVASKGRFSRALSKASRLRDGLPVESTLSTDEFLEATLDIWEIQPESARRVGHPAPFPVTLPERLINLYTFRDDLVLDPFMGSGTTLVAAARTGRRAVGYDLDPLYVQLARQRLAEESGGDADTPVVTSKIVDAAAAVLAEAGFSIEGTNRRVNGVPVSVVARAADGTRWLVDVSGGFTVARNGLTTTDGLLRALGRAALLSSIDPHVLLLTSHLPKPTTEAHRLLHATRNDLFVDALEILDDGTPDVLLTYAGQQATGTDERLLPKLV
jgi:DNA modification methylase